MGAVCNLSHSRSVMLLVFLLITCIGDSYKLLRGYRSSRFTPNSNSVPRLQPLHAQSLDYTSLYLSVSELAQVSVPGKVENVVQENEYNIFVGIKTITGSNVWLQLCWHPSAARLGLGYAPPRGETTPYSFAATLRALLRGHSVTRVHLPTAFDRIAEIEFSERLSDEKPKWRLILEVMGARSNAILVSHDDNVIQACAYQVSSTTTVRPLQTGGVYQQPPSGGGIFSPIYKDSVEVNDFLPIFSGRLRELDVTVEKSLVSCYRGMSPNIARRILSASNVDGSVKVRSLDDKDVQTIFKHFAAWASIFDNSLNQRLQSSDGNGIGAGAGLGALPILNVKPQLVDFKEKKTTEFCPISFSYSDSAHESTPLIGYDAQSSSSIPSPNDGHLGPKSTDTESDLALSKFLLSFYSLYERKVAFKLLQASCEKKVALRIKKASKILKDFKEQEEDAKGEKCEDLKALGDLITSFTHSYKEKSQVLQCYDFITGEPKVIAIPLGVSPSDYAKSTYMKAKKLKRSLKVLENLIRKANLHVEYLLEIDSAVSGLAEYISYEDITTLLEIEEELDDLEQLTIIQLGDAATPGEVLAMAEKVAEKEKDKKKSKSKLKSGKQTKSTVKAAPAAKKGNTNTPPSSRKKALQGLLILRPSSGNSAGVRTDMEERKGSKKDRGSSDSLSSTLPSLVVGRSSKQNDRITFDIAKEHHLWFHVQGSPGSHVLLQLEPGDQPSEEGIQYAADVASFYSKARGSTQVPVGYCSPKHIRRITGGSPGMVSILQQAGVVYGCPDKGKLWVEKYGPQTVETYR